MTTAVALWAVCTCVGFAQQEGQARRGSPRQAEEKERTAVPVIPPGWEGVSARGLAHAAESARMDALKRLARRIDDLRLPQSRRVKDFTATSDAVAAELARPFQGVNFLSPGYTRDQICTVRVRVATTDVVAHLRALNHKYGNGRFSDRDFDAIAVLNRADSIEALGQGVPWLDDLPWRRGQGTAPAPEWAGRTLRASGTGRQPDTNGSSAQARLIAIARAKRAARQAITEEVRGLDITGRPRITLGDELDRRPQLAGAFDEWIRRAKVVRSTWKPDGEVFVEIEANLGELWDVVAPRDFREQPESKRRMPEDKSRRRAGESRSRP